MFTKFIDRLSAVKKRRISALVHNECRARSMPDDWASGRSARILATVCEAGLGG